MTMQQHDDMVNEIVNGTMSDLTKTEKIDVVVGCLAAINDETEYPTRVPIDMDNLADPF